MSAPETITGGGEAPPPPPPVEASAAPPAAPGGPEEIVFHARATEDGILIALEARGLVVGGEIDVATARQWVAALNAAVGSAFSRTLWPVPTKGG